MSEVLDNPRAVIGSNAPPEAIDPFEAISVHIADLYLECGNWADGAEIENDDQAVCVDRLLDDVKDAIVAAEQARDGAIKPLSDRITAIRERWYPLIGETKAVTGKAIRAKRALLQVKTVWGNKKEATRRAEAERLRLQAEADAQAAAEAARAAIGNLEAAESTEDLVKTAQASLRAARQAEKPVTRGMRTEWVTVMTDETVAMRTIWSLHRQEFMEFALQLARRDVRDGRRKLDGFSITETKVAV